MISERRDCRGRKCTTVLHGGVHRQTLTPHKSGTKKKRQSWEKDITDIFDTMVTACRVAEEDRHRFRKDIWAATS